MKKSSTPICLWEWHGDPSAYFRSLSDAVSKKIRDESTLPRWILERLIAAAEQRSDWLFHPCLDYVLIPGAGSPSRGLQLAAWTVLNSPGSTEVITATTAGSIWFPNGSEQPYGAGVPICLDHARFAADRTDGMGDLVAPDLSGSSTSAAVPGVGASVEEASQVLAWFDLIPSFFPACAMWIRSAVKVAILRANVAGRTMSGSGHELPGAIWLTMPQGRCDALETIVHEAAHSHLLLEELHAPLIYAEFQRTTVYSPLRKCNRPLRGALFAAHAIAYMMAFHHEFIERFGAVEEFVLRRQELGGMFRDLLSELALHESAFSDRGKAALHLLERFRHAS